jgi:uncharacterized protein (DUF433 family)
MEAGDYIHSDPAILAGKPVIRGTRLGVDFLRGLLAAGWTDQHVLDEYPHLDPRALKALRAGTAPPTAAVP